MRWLALPALLALTAGCLQVIDDGQDVPTGAIDGILFFIRDVDTDSGAQQVPTYELRGDPAAPSREGPAWVAFGGRMTVRVFAQVPANDCLPEEERVVLTHNVTFAPQDFRVVEEPAVRADGTRFTARNAVLLGELPVIQFVNSGAYRIEAFVVADGGGTYTESEREFIRNSFPELKTIPREGASELGSLYVGPEGGSHSIRLRGANEGAGWSSDCTFSAHVRIDVERRTWSASTNAPTYSQTGTDEFDLVYTDFLRDFFGAFHQRILPETVVPTRDSYRLTVTAMLEDGRMVTTQAEMGLGRDV